MQSALLKKLNIKKQESGYTLLLFISAILLGIFLSSFEMLMHAAFFKEWEQAYIPMVYLCSGGSGVIIFAIYIFLQKHLSYKLFYFLNLFFLVCVTVGYLIVFLIIDDKLLYFIGLVLFFPVSLIAVLNFWRFLRKTLLPGQTRRLFTSIELGILLGIVITGGSYFLLLRDFDYSILAVFSIVSIISLFLVQIPVNLYHNRSDVFNHKEEKRIPVKASLFILWTTKFTRSLLMFSLVSSVIGFLLHFGFISLFWRNFQEIEQFSMYYGFFLILLYVLTIVADKFLIHKLLYSYDSPYSLVLMPIGVALFFGLTSVGTILLFKFDQAHLILFLILIVINKLVYEIGRSTLQLPSQRTLYRVLDLRFMQLIYPRVEGAMVMLGLLIAGGIMIPVQDYISSPIYFGIFGFMLSVLWFLLTVRLIRKYKIALQDSYRKLRISRTGHYRQTSYNEKIRKILVGDDPVKVINAMKLSARIEPLSYEKGLQRMLANPQPAIQNYVLRCIDEESLIELLPELKKLNPSSVKTGELLGEIIKNFEHKENLLKKGVDLEQLVNSRKVKDRVLAAEIIGSRRDITYTSFLVNLSREFEPAVKIAAVKAMARISSSDHSYLLIEYLFSPEYHAYAFESLVQIGDPALDYLERLFINPNTDDRVLARVVRIYGKVGTSKAIELLLGKLENQSKKVTQATIGALHEANFQASSLNVHKILNIVVRTIHLLGWNFLVYSSLSSKVTFKNLKVSYLQEIKNGYDLLFDLLSLAYNARTIYEIRDLIDHGSAADLSHAIEMLDHFVYEDIKPVLFPVIEDIPVKEKVKRLQYYFPIESMTEEEMISSSLIRDYNLLDIYPRICAMQLALTIPEFEINYELIANLFHPNRLLREVAATVIHRKNPEIFEDVIQRLEPEVQFEMRDMLESLELGNRLLLIQKFELLKNNDKLADMPEAILIEFAEAFHEHTFTAGERVDLAKNIKEYSLFFLIRGNMQLEGDGILEPAQVNKLYYSNIFVNAGVTELHFTADSLVLAITDEIIETLLFDHSEIASCVLSCVEQFKLAG